MKGKNPNNNPKTLRKIFQLLQPVKALLIIALICTAFSSGFQLATIKMAQYFIDDVLPSIEQQVEQIEISEEQIVSLKESCPVVADLKDEEVALVVKLLQAENTSIAIKIQDLKNRDPFFNNLEDEDISELIKTVDDYEPSTIQNKIDKTLSGYFQSIDVRSFIFIVMILFVSYGVTHGIGMFLSVLLGQKVVLNLRMTIFNHLQELSSNFYEDQQTGGIMSWLTNDINVFRMFSSNQLNSFVQNSVLVLGALIGLFFISWQLALVSFCIVPLLGVVIHYAGSRMRKATRRVQEKLSDISSVLHEVISAIQIVKSFGMESHEVGRFKNENVQTYKAEMKKAWISALLQPAIQMVVAIGIMVILLIGINQLSNGILQTGQLIVFVTFLHIVSDKGKRLGQTYANLNELFAAGDRIFEFLDVKSDIVEIENPVELADVKGDVTFRNLSFSYDNSDLVLKNINIAVPSGKVIALVGPSGAGKSSMGKLLPRFYDPTGGQVLVDGVDIKTASIKSLRAQLGIVPQETILFSTTIRENIAYGRLDASMEDIIEAAKAANAHEFITKLPDGYDTLVGERGSKLSGGQAQRVSIARAILKNPRILILDEATSSLDAQSEELVQQALEKLMAGRTTFIIAHRLTTIKNADEIIVLSQGEIAQRGTHEELMGVDGIYRNLYQMQSVGANGDIDNRSSHSDKPDYSREDDS
ncbi:ABC transporter ATP-binding protein [bacterium]|nr:ABC transporter ATP-binding protein [bacterium]